ncbi:hypothetical protein JC221_233 [Yersinia phage JC221]|nr:hypothetical protein JC221_233 [Yersinia phage JC221]
MPTYTYKCKICNKEFSKMSSIANRDAPKECECGGEAKRTVDKPQMVKDGFPYNK